MRYLLLTLLLVGISPAQAGAQDMCDTAAYIHNYPVHNADSYDRLFKATEGYRAGKEGAMAWPFGPDVDATYRTRDYCPVESGGRLVRLFEIPPEELKSAGYRAGTLTLVARDLAAARAAVSGLAVEGPRNSILAGRESFYFMDEAGNEFFVWAYPGPPDG